MSAKGSATATAFQNIKGRRIFQGERGGFFAIKDGKKYYNPKAAFRQVGNGPKSKVTKASLNVPTPIRRAVPVRAKKPMATPNEGNMTRKLFATPKARKPRSNKGVARKPMSTPNEGNLTRKLFATPKARKPRSNKGVARKPMNTPNQGNTFRYIFATPKTRKPRANKGKARGPREGTILRRMNTEAKKMAKKTSIPQLNIFVSPGGTAMTKRQIAGRKAAATRKARIMKGNPYGALA